MTPAEQLQNSIEIWQYKSVEEFIQDLEKKSLSGIASKVRRLYEQMKETAQVNSQELISTLKEQLDSQEEAEIRTKLDGKGLEQVFDDGLSQEDKTNALTREALWGVIWEKHADTVIKVEGFFNRIKVWFDSLEDLFKSKGFAAGLGWIALFLKWLFSWDFHALELLAHPEKAAEKAKESAQHLAEQTKKALKGPEKTYRDYWKTFFTFFKAGKEADFLSWRDTDLENQICNDLTWNDTFLNLSYADLKNGKDAEKIADELITSNQVGAYANYDREIVIKHVQLAYKSFTWGEVSEKKENKILPEWLWTPDTTTVNITSGHEFLNGVYQVKYKKSIDDITPPPTVKQILEILDSVTHLDKFNISWLDYENILTTLKSSMGWALWLLRWGDGNLLEWGIDEHAFENMKSEVPLKLQHVGRFATFSRAILKTQGTRSLKNNFQVGSWVHDPITEANNEELNAFVPELAQFGHEVVQNMFKAGKPVKWLEDLDENTLSIIDIYNIYILTGGQSNPDMLSPTKKFTLSMFLSTQFGESPAESFWKFTWKVMRNGKEIEFPPEVINIGKSILSTMTEVAKKALSEVYHFGLWLFKENPIAVILLLAALVFLPIFHPGRVNLFSKIQWLGK